MKSRLNSDKRGKIKLRKWPSGKDCFLYNHGYLIPDSSIHIKMWVLPVDKSRSMGVETGDSIGIFWPQPRTRFSDRPCLKRRNWSE